MTIVVNGIKYSCGTCIRGHRTSSCNHQDRQLFEVRKKGRPPSNQCRGCRRKSQPTTSLSASSSLESPDAACTCANCGTQAVSAGVKRPAEPSSSVDYSYMKLQRTTTSPVTKPDPYSAYKHPSMPCGCPNHHPHQHHAHHAHSYHEPMPHHHHHHQPHASSGGSYPPYAAPPPMLGHSNSYGYGYPPPPSRSLPLPPYSYPPGRPQAMPAPAHAHTPGYYLPPPVPTRPDYFGTAFPAPPSLPYPTPFSLKQEGSIESITRTVYSEPSPMTETTNPLDVKLAPIQAQPAPAPVKAEPAEQQGQDAEACKPTPQKKECCGKTEDCSCPTWKKVGIAGACDAGQSCPCCP